MLINQKQGASLSEALHKKIHYALPYLNSTGLLQMTTLIISLFSSLFCCSRFICLISPIESTRPDVLNFRLFFVYMLQTSCCFFFLKRIQCCMAEISRRQINEKSGVISIAIQYLSLVNSPFSFTHFHKAFCVIIFCYHSNRETTRVLI